jgi:hypothetical protein
MNPHFPSMTSLDKNTLPSPPPVLAGGEPAVRLAGVDHIKLLMQAARRNCAHNSARQFQEVVQVAMPDSMGQVVSPDALDVVPKAAQRLDGLQFSSRCA